MISQSKQKGFTIVELLIVIVVIGILAAISIVAYNGVTQKARDDGRLTDARSLVNAAASYQAEEGSWPTIAQVQDYKTVKLTGNAADATKVTATAPTSTAKDVYGYTICSTGTPAANTGVRVTYYKEAGADAGVKTITSGSC